VRPGFVKIKPVSILPVNEMGEGRYEKVFPGTIFWLRILRHLLRHNDGSRIVWPLILLAEKKKANNRKWD